MAALKDLPRVAGDLKSEIEGFKPGNLKSAVIQEKIVLPSAQDVAAEKSERALIEDIEHFDHNKLKHIETQEKNPLPNKEVVEKEKIHQNLFNEVKHFDKSMMKHPTATKKNIFDKTEAHQDVPLLTKEMIEQEKND